MRQDSDDRKTGRPRRKTRMSLKIPVLIIVLVLAVVTTIALMLPVFNVVEVYCEGNSEVKTEDIITAAKLETGKNIFLENLGRARRSVESITNIKSAEIRRVFPNKICISVSERVPFAYVPSNGGVAIVSEEGIVLKVSDGGEAAMISDAKTPKFDTAQTDGEKSDSSKTNDKKSDSENKNSDTTDDSDNKNDDSSDNNDSNSDNKSNDSKNSDKSDSQNSDSGQNNSGLDSAAGQTENSDVLAVPLVSGFELNNVKEGKKAESGDSDKFNKMYELCRALKGAELLNRTTYINVENLDDITVVIENRLEVQLAKAENINYRCRFLAEVINTKLSATESVILDYRGDDIYAINRDDGGERVKKTKTNKSTDNSDGTTDKKNGADTDGSDNSDDSTGSNDTNSSNSSSSSSSSSNSSNSSNSSGSNSSSNSDSSSSKKNSGSSRTNSTSSDEQDEYL
ncbi:MAG: FtsQ-type POTRA domain-containing protein [Eubacteriales bacterium]|nr:FtsQ-type POTRA domain-containing protein [Eubacteriales bacterium]